MRKFLVFAVAVVALAQEPIQVTTRLVQVAVVVRDKRGAVADLTKNDFEVFDRGKQQKIASFTVARASDHVSRATLPENTFSNRLNQQSDSPVAATVLLFDSLNTAFKDQADARKQILGLLKDIDPTSPVAIYALGNSLRILHDFTEDHARLELALQRYRNGTSTLFSNSQSEPRVPSSVVSPTPADPGTISVPDTADLIAQILEPLQNYSTDRRVAITLSAMQLIANRMAGVPGRKNLIWISGGFPLTMAFDRRGVAGGGAAQVTYSGPMRDAAMAIDRANVAVYPVDARGLMVSSTIREEMPGPRNQNASGQTYNLPTSESMNNTREIETMKLLADWTGGRAFYNSNDTRGAVARAMEDAEVTYTLGFYADEKVLDGSYHELKVKVSRKGADASYRKGYFASPIVSVAGQSAVEILKTALAGAADSTGIRLTASLAPAPTPPGSFVVALNMDLQPLNLELRTGRWADDVNFAIVQQDAGGIPLDSVSNTIHLEVTDGNRDQLRKEGLTVQLRITPAPGLSQIRIAAMDQATGNVGSLRILPPRQP